MKKLFFAVTLLACAGCAPAVTKVNVPDIVKSDALHVGDTRPATEKKDEIFSLLITSKQYGIIRAGDTKLSPTPLRLLQHEAFEKFAASGHTPEVTVSHFVIYENMRSQLRSGAVGAGLGGVLGGVVGNAIASHDASALTTITDEKAFDSVSDEYQRGLYTSAENPNKASVYIIYVETDIDGKKVFTRTIAAMKPHGEEKQTLPGAVQLAIRNHLSQYDAGTMAAVTQASAATSTPEQVSMTTATADSGNQGAAQEAPTGADAEAARSLARQMGCGGVRDSGGSTFTAECSGYGLAIACDSGKCHPTHTIKSEH